MSNLQNDILEELNTIQEKINNLQELTESDFEMLFLSALIEEEGQNE